jgi:hypothetical protein
VNPQSPLKFSKEAVLFMHVGQSPGDLRRGACPAKPLTTSDLRTNPGRLQLGFKRTLDYLRLPFYLLWTLSSPTHSLTYLPLTCSGAPSFHGTIGTLHHINNHASRFFSGWSGRRFRHCCCSELQRLQPGGCRLWQGLERCRQHRQRPHA